MNLKHFVFWIVGITLLIGCNLTTRTEYVYLTEDESKERADLVYTYKGRLITNSKDGFEEDDNSSLANEISINQLQEHNYYDDAVDWLKFYAESGLEYIIESWVYESGDTKLYLYNSSMTQLEYNDDKGDGTYGSVITWTAPETGMYYIKSNSYGNNIGVNRGYEISISTEAIGKDAFEDDDNASTAKEIIIDETQHHNFFDDSQDWVKINVENGYNYTFESTVSGNADTYIHLFNSDLTEIDSDDDGGVGYGSKIEFSCTASSTLYLRMDSYGGRTGAGHDYSITVSRVENPGEIVLPLEQKKWTVLVYLCADNNLSPFGTSDIEEMISVGSTTDFNIVALWDNSGTEHGYYYIQNGEATLIQDLGEINMGSDHTAINFIDWAVTNFPADHYMLDYWNHGGAVDRATGQIKSRGVAWDDTNGHDWLSETEQRNIINFFYNKIGRKIDIVSYDACLMATAEIAYMYNGYADYLVASEELEPGDGWDYAFLNILKDNPNTSAEALARNVLTYYKNWYSTYNDVTFSVTDLDHINELIVALDRFCDSAISTNNGSLFKSLTSNVGDFTGYTKDLYGYLNNVTNSSSISESIKSNAQNAMDIIANDLIIDEYHGSSWTNKAFGLSITMKADTAIYSELDICKDSSWDEFLDFCDF